MNHRFLEQIFAVFEYLNRPSFVQRFQFVIEDVNTQLGYIEQVTGQPYLRNWWRAFINDFLYQIALWARTWADDAINIAGAPFVEASNNGRRLTQYNTVINALRALQARIDNDLAFK